MPSRQRWRVVSVRGWSQQRKAAGAALQPVLLSPADPAATTVCFGAEEKLSCSQAGAGAAAEQGCMALVSAQHHPDAARAQASKGVCVAGGGAATAIPSRCTGTRVPSAADRAVQHPAAGPGQHQQHVAASQHRGSETVHRRIPPPTPTAPTRHWQAVRVTAHPTMSWDGGMDEGHGCRQPHPNPPPGAGCEEKTAHHTMLLPRRAFRTCSRPRTLGRSYEVKREQRPQVHSMESRVPWRPLRWRRSSGRQVAAASPHRGRCQIPPSPQSAQHTLPSLPSVRLSIPNCRRQAGSLPGASATFLQAVAKLCTVPAQSGVAVWF